LNNDSSKQGWRLQDSLSELERGSFKTTFIANIEKFDPSITRMVHLNLVLNNESLVCPVAEIAPASWPLTYSRDGFLNIDAATHDALQIFQVDKHASSMGIGKAKEG
jgi:hypothetical protein